ncbi:MAG: restriction endonuclease subunit S [Clostridia bacterium]|nr:restriction endonuclease subunit S [Clostridia bacterium]
MTSSLNEKLRTVKWGKYKTSELFKPQKITRMLSKEDLSNDFCFPAYSSESTNNGIIGYTNSPEFICDDEYPVFVTFGDHTRSFNIANKSFSVLDNVKVLQPSIHNIRCLLWIITAWQKQIPNLGYARHWKIAKNCIVELPTKNGKIDFDFMESFVAELEAQRVAELSAYLKVCGYDNYELSAEELDALRRFGSLEDNNWGTYKVGNLFERVETKKLPYKAKELPKQPTEDYVLPCLTSSFQNQGLNYYAPKIGATILSNVISIPSNSDVYRAYYQSREFTVLSDSYAIRWKSNKIKISPNHYLFMVMCINKVTDLPIYSYKNKLGGWNVVKEKNIRLPKKNGEIDFALMETFISAIKKLAIKDVVLYSNQKIKTTKSVVSSHSNQ